MKIRNTSRFQGVIEFVVNNKYYRAMKNGSFWNVYILKNNSYIHDAIVEVSGKATATKVYEAYDYACYCEDMKQYV
jgi:hypothetical protein